MDAQDAGAETTHQTQAQRRRVLLVGNDCVSKDVAAKLRRANYTLAKFDDVAAGLEAAAAVQFDFAIIDADGMGPTELANVRQAFVRRGLRAIATMRRDTGGATHLTSPGAPRTWELLPKPVAFESLVSAFQASASS